MHPQKYFNLNSFINEILSVEKFRTMVVSSITNTGLSSENEVNFLLLLYKWPIVVPPGIITASRQRQHTQPHYSI